MGDGENIKNMMVSVIMITYGHENYIEEAINGVFMQQTDFPVELIIANDCSPDNTDEVVTNLMAKAPENVTVKYTRHDSNKGMGSNFTWAAGQCTGKYIAHCEGDDYWTDPLKLQKQVDFLDKNLSYVASSHHRYLLKNNLFIKQPYDTKHFFTQCLVFRNILIEDDYLHLEKIFNGDSFLNLILETRGEIKYMDFYGAVYRFDGSGVYSSLNEKDKLDKGYQSLTYMIQYLYTLPANQKNKRLLHETINHANAIVLSKCNSITESRYKKLLYFCNNFKYNGTLNYFKSLFYSVCI